MGIPVYLLITAGRTDLKVLVNTEGLDGFAPVDIKFPEKKDVRRLHQWMLDYPERWTIDASSQKLCNRHGASATPENESACARRFPHPAMLLN